MESRSLAQKRTVATLLGATLVAAPLALATPLFTGVAFAAPGTLKVHGPETLFDIKANEPKPGCEFYLAAFDLKKNIGDELDYVFTIQGNQPAGTNGAEIGTAGKITIDKDSDPDDKKEDKDDGFTAVLKQADHGLPDGQFKVTLNDPAKPNDPAKVKSKVFRVNCPGGTDPEPPPPPPPPPCPMPPCEVGGVDTPPPGEDEDKPKKDKKKDRDDGPGAVGGVNTGAGGSAGATSNGAAAPMLPTASGVTLVAAHLSRSRRSTN